MAADRNFSFGSIPSGLLENSNTVIRFHETTLEIKSAGKAAMKVNYALTVLNAKATDNAILVVFYNKFTKIRHLKGAVYDKNGEKVERIEADQFMDLSAISGFSTYEDNRMVVCRPRYQSVPFTVEYSYDIDYNGILDFPDFFLVSDFNEAVEQSRLTVSVNDTIGIRYFQRNLASACTVNKQKSVETYTWDFSNIPSLRKEPYSPPITGISPSVLLAPRSFELKGIRGNTDNWKSLGWWFYELIKDRDDLRAETRQKVNALIAGVGDTLKKVEILYHYLQEKTRYASIQIGIGGWQPDWASEVDRLGYGDCKALVNYMKSLLTAAGISSYYTLVHAGKDEPDIITGFPAHQFNHVILCVPVNNDTLWLECTSQDLPLGYLSTFTDDRSVLLIKESGGFLCRTPVYGQDVNTMNRSGTVNLLEGGNAEMNVKTSMHGLFYDASRVLMHMDETDKRKELMANISASDFVLDSYTLKENKTDFPGIEETLNLTIRNIFTKAGGLMLFAPNRLTREEQLSSQVIKRNNPVEIRRSTLKTDTIFYTLPNGFAVTGNPVDVTIVSKFGKYRAVTEIKGETLRYIRNLVIYKGTHPQESYEDFLDFFEKIYTADSKKLALKTIN